MLGIKVTHSVSLICFLLYMNFLGEGSCSVHLGMRFYGIISEVFDCWVFWRVPSSVATHVLIWISQASKANFSLLLQALVF